MTKDMVVKVATVTPMAAFIAHLNALYIPIVILVSVIAIDYLSGMIKAWMNSELSSKLGIKGIIKKVAYLLLVAVSVEIDWLIREGLSHAGIQMQFGDIIALLVIIWLIINEMISILENLGEIGVPKVPGIDRLLSKIKLEAEKRADKISGDNNEKKEDKNGTDN